MHDHPSAMTQTHLENLWPPLPRGQLASRRSVHRHVWICAPDVKLHCSCWTDKRERLMWRHDNDQLYNPTGAGCFCHLGTKALFTSRCRLRLHQGGKKNYPNLHMCLLCNGSLCMHAPSLLAYAEQHRWACGGMGAVSSQIKLWVGGPIAIHHAST